MKKSKILAHRGFWNQQRKPNSKESLISALKNNYGIETDLRANEKGQIVISHDPLEPYDEEQIEFDWLIKAQQELSPESVLALNVKEDGLHEKILNTVKDLGEYFLFDMSIPDLVGAKKYNLISFARSSEFEDPIMVKTLSDGVWIDSFNGKMNIRQLIEKYSAEYNRFAIVSPELHKKEKDQCWHELKHLQQDFKQMDIMICTDFPDEAERFF